MSERVIVRPRLNSALRISLRLIPLLLLLPWLRYPLVQQALAQDVSHLGSGGELAPVRQVAPAHDMPEATTLEPDKPVKSELSGGQKHLYQILLSKGQHIKVMALV